MQYRITITLVVAIVITGAVLLLTLNNRQGASTEPGGSSRTELPGELGIVAAMTATAVTRQASLDPTAITSPDILETHVPAVGSTPTPESGSLPGLVLTLSNSTLTPGSSFSLEITGAHPGESFNVSLAGTTLFASGVADQTGAASIEAAFPPNTPPGEYSLAVSGSESAPASISITISQSGPAVSISPEKPAGGETVRIDGSGFAPSEMVSARVEDEPVGSAVAGSDGAFSISTRLPELEAGDQSLFLEGSSGSSASVQMNTAGSVGAGARPVAAATPITDPGDTDSEDKPFEPIELQEPPAEESPLSPGWVYAAAGAVAAWLAVLTVWVYRLDRSRDRSSIAVAEAVERVLSSHSPSASFNRGPAFSDTDIDDAA